MQGPPAARQHLSCPQLLLGAQPHAGTVFSDSQVWIVKETCRDAVPGEAAPRDCHKHLLLLHPLNSQNLVAHKLIKFSAEVLALEDYIKILFNPF